MSAWNDRIGIGDYDYQWLHSAALMNTRNPDGQPIGVATGTAVHLLAHHGSGIGSAAEGSGSLITSSNPSIQSAQEVFMHRFCSLGSMVAAGK
jgi:hypothetical protein